MIKYIYSVDEFMEGPTSVKTNFFPGKKVLFTFGDSWTNNNYLNSRGSYPEKCWSYQLAEKLNYDVVVNIATNGGSNEEIFSWCLNTMCLYDGEYRFDKCKIHELGAAEIKVVIGWSSQLRDFGTLKNIFRPYNVASLPFPYGNTLGETLYQTYVNNLHPEYYCFQTQMETIALQHYFQQHNIESFYFMAFTPLLEQEVVGTKWDFRHLIDEKRFYNLFTLGNSMCSLLNELCDEPDKHEHVVETPMLYVETLKNYYLNLFSKKTDKQKYLLALTNPNSKYFVEDGHPNEAGLEVISNELYNMIRNHAT